MQDQASGKVQVSKEAEVSHCHVLAKRRAAYRRRNEACTETERRDAKIETARPRGVSECNIFLLDMGCFRCCV